MASWYDSNYKFRAPITLHPTAGSPQDFQIIVPPTMAIFWDNVLATGADLRVCDSDGITLLTFDRASFVYASKTLTIEIDNYVYSSVAPVVIWMYWGYASAADAVTVFAPVGTELGRIAASAGLSSVSVSNAGGTYSATLAPAPAKAGK